MYSNFDDDCCIQPEGFTAPLSLSFFSFFSSTFLFHFEILRKRKVCIKRCLYGWEGRINMEEATHQSHQILIEHWGQLVEPPGSLEGYKEEGIQDQGLWRLICRGRIRVGVPYGAKSCITRGGTGHHNWAGHLGHRGYTLVGWENGHWALNIGESYRVFARGLVHLSSPHVDDLQWGGGEGGGRGLPPSTSWVWGRIKVGSSSPDSTRPCALAPQPSHHISWCYPHHTKEDY